MSIINRKYKMLDCYCGLGGASDGFALEGFDVLGIEIEPDIAKLYKHDVIVTDFSKLNGKYFKEYDVIWGSPPCRDFATFSYAVWKKGKNYQNRRWKEPPNPKKGLRNVYTYLKFIENANPKIWIMENVPELEQYLKIPPIMRKVKLTKTMIRSFWGNFPIFLMPQSTKERYIDLQRSTHFKEIKSVFPYRKLLASFIYAKIPIPCSRAFARACKEGIKNEYNK